MHESAAIIPTKERCISSESVGVLEMDGGPKWCFHLLHLVAEFDTSPRRNTGRQNELFLEVAHVLFQKLSFVIQNRHDSGFCDSRDDVKAVSVPAHGLVAPP